MTTSNLRKYILQATIFAIGLALCVGVVYFSGQYIPNTLPFIKVLVPSVVMALCLFGYEYSKPDDQKTPMRYRISLFFICSIYPIAIGISAILDYYCLKDTEWIPGISLDITFAILLLLVIGVSTLIVGSANRKERILTEYKWLLSLTGAPIPPDIDKLPTSELRRRFLALAEEMEETPEAFPNSYMNKALEWVTHLPAAIDSLGTPLITIRGFTYSLIPLGIWDRQNSRYLLRVYIEFTAENSTIAHHLREALKSENPFVNLDPHHYSKGILEWAVYGNYYYRISFTLKQPTADMQGGAP